MNKQGKGDYAIYRIQGIMNQDISQGTHERRVKLENGVRNLSKIASELGP